MGKSSARPSLRNSTPGPNLNRKCSVSFRSTYINKETDDVISAVSRAPSSGKYKYVPTGISKPIPVLPRSDTIGKTKSLKCAKKRCLPLPPEQFPKPNSTLWPNWMRPSVFRGAIKKSTSAAAPSPVQTSSLSWVATPYFHRPPTVRTGENNPSRDDAGLSPISGRNTSSSYNHSTLYEIDRVRSRKCCAQCWKMPEKRKATLFKGCLGVWAFV